MTKTAKLQHPNKCTVFQTELGWMALVTSARTIQKLTFAHDTAKSAKVQFSKGNDAGFSGMCTDESSSNDTWLEKLIERLQDYAVGRPVEFHEFEVNTHDMTDFGRRVILACRKISYGSTTTYGELAARARSDGAARAVGNHMAKNQIPLIIPCHRVLAGSGNRLGGYSASGGVELKRRLLKMEAENTGYYPG